MTDDGFHLTRHLDYADKHCTYSHDGRILWRLP